MKIYEGTDGLRGLVKKLIEVWDFKKIVYEGDGATLSTNDVVFNLTCPCVGTYSNISPKRRWVIYKQDGLAAIGIDGNQNDRPGINIVIGEVTDYETQEKGYGLATSCADNNIRLCSVFTDGMTIKSVPVRPVCRRKWLTSFTPVTSSTLNKGFTNLYHILSHTSGQNDSDYYPDYAVPTQTVLLNGKKYLLSRFAFEIKE